MKTSDFCLTYRLRHIVLLTMVNLCGFVGRCRGRKFDWGIGIYGIKGKSQFSVASVATEVNSVEQVSKGYSIWRSEFSSSVVVFACILLQLCSSGGRNDNLK